MADDDMYSNFTSQTKINTVREEKKRARELVLEKAKRKFEIDEARRERARLQGEGIWMLDSVSHRISKEEKDLLKAKKKSKKKKKKKSKKFTSSSASGSDNEKGKEEWVEAEKNRETNAVVKGPQLQRESWMEAPLDLIPTTSRQDIRTAINKSKDEARKAAEKELETLKNLEKMLAEAKKKTRFSGGGSTTSEMEISGRIERTREAIDCREGRAERGGHKDRRANRNDRRDRSRSTERERRERSKSRERGRGDRSKSRERGRRDRSKSRERGRGDRSRSTERGRGDRSKSRERGRRDRSRERGRRDRSRERSGSNDRRREITKSQDRRFMKPDREERPSSRPPLTDATSGRRKPGFMRPDHSESWPSSSDGRRRGKITPDTTQPRWKKKVDMTDRVKDLSKQQNKSERENNLSNQEHGQPERQEKLDTKQKPSEKRRRTSLTSSSDSSGDSGDSSASEDNDTPCSQPPKILSEEELNDLAAKILRAEIMGDE
ncbi:CWF19-like protein 2, partial [Elysia marginata]